MEEQELTIYQRLGAENLKELINLFYDLVFSNEQIGHLFQNTPKDVIKQKQIMFLTQFLGGPAVYSEYYGHPKMRARHIPHKITENGAKEWLLCMGNAIKQLEIDEQLKKDLFMCFPQAAFHMVNTEE